MLEELRAATRPLHDRLDGAPLSGRVTDGTLTVDDYRALIGWQHAAHAEAEGGLEDFDWPEGYAYRSRGGVLHAEALTLGLATIRPEELKAPASLAAAAGRAYVLEGSSLGGNMVLGHLQRNERLAGLSSLDFYSFQREVGAGQWRRFLAFAKTWGWSQEEVQEAVTEAKTVFGVFAGVQRGRKARPLTPAAASPAPPARPTDDYRPAGS